MPIMPTGDEKDFATQRRQAMVLLRTIASELRRPYILFFFATLFFSASGLLLPQFFLIFTENAAKISEISFADFLPKFVTFGVLIGVILFVAAFASNYMREWFQLKTERHLRSKILSRLHDMSITEIDRVQRGDWLTRTTMDLRNVERFISESLPGQLRSFFILLGSAGVFIYYSHTMATVPIVACMIIATLNVFVQKKILPLLDEIRDLHGDVTQALLQGLEGIKTIRSYGAQQDQIRRFSHQLAIVETKGLRVARCFGLLVGSNDAVTQFLTTFALAFIMIALSKGNMTLAAALAYPFYLNLFYSSAEFLAASSLDWNEFFVSGARFEGITREKKKLIRTTSFDQKLLPTVERIDLWGVSYGYSSENPLKRDYHFSCRKHEMIVILGPSGSGKSTFLEVLSGLRQPFSGCWLLKTKHDQKIESFIDTPLPTQLSAYVEQKPYIFEGTIRDNLLLGEERPLKAIWDAATEANALSFIQENGGLNHFLQDSGQNISEGQKYRIAIARALLRQRPFLLLDEPFAALDRFNAEMIAQTLNNCRTRCGIVIVTHFIPHSLRPDKVIDFERVSPSVIETIPQVHQDLRDR